MSCLLELAVRTLPSYTATYSLVVRRLITAPAIGRALVLRQTNTLPTRRRFTYVTACFSTEVAPRVDLENLPHLKLNSLHTSDSGWQGSDKRKENTRINGITLTAGAGLLLCAASSRRGMYKLCDS